MEEYNITVKDQIKVIEPYFTYIKDGIKTFEGRLDKGKYKKYVIGDIIIITNEENNNSFEVKIINIFKFSSYQEAFETISVDKLLPGIFNKNQGVIIYKSFYSFMEQLDNGVLIFEIERI